jgi:hypothetical protein
MPLPQGYFVPAQFILPPLVFQADWALFVASVEAQSKRYRIWTYINPDQSEPEEPPANTDFSAIQAFYAITNALAASNSKYGVELAICQTPREMLQLLRKHYRPDPSRLLETFIKKYDELSKGPVDQKFDKWADEFELLVISSKALDDNLYRDRSSYLWATSAYEAIKQADPLTWGLMKYDFSILEKKSPKALETFLGNARSFMTSYTAKKDRYSYQTDTTFSTLSKPQLNDLSDENPSKPKLNCQCGCRHHWIDCPYHNKDLQSVDWRPDPATKAKIDKLMEDEDYKQKVYKHFKRVKNLQAQRAKQSEDHNAQDKTNKHIAFGPI